MAWGEEEKDKIRIISHQTLLANGDREIKHISYFVIPVVIFTLIITILLSFLLWVPAPWSDEGNGWLLAMCIVGQITLAWPVIAIITSAAIEWYWQAQIKQKRYVVIDDVLQSVSSNEAHPPNLLTRLLEGRRYYEEDYYATFYFSRCGRQPVSRGLFNASAVGDRFYVILVPGKKEKVLGIYHQSLYRWAGDPAPQLAKD